MPFPRDDPRLPIILALFFTAVTALAAYVDARNGGEAADIMRAMWWLVGMTWCAIGVLWLIGAFSTSAEDPRQ